MLAKMYVRPRSTGIIFVFRLHKGILFGIKRAGEYTIYVTNRAAFVMNRGHAQYSYHHKATVKIVVLSRAPQPIQVQDPQQ